MRRLLALAALVIAPSAGPALAEPPPPPAVTVSGEGVATAAPDIAIIQSGVVTRAQTAGAALKDNAAAMTKVLAAIKQAGVEDRDVGTSGLSVQPQYDYGDNSGGPRAPKLVAYEVRNTVTIRSRAVDRLGALVDTLVQAGSNQIDNLAFDVSDRDRRLDEARKEAIEDARRKAEIFAKAAGAKLGRPISIDETEFAEPPVRPMAMRAKAMDAAPTPIARGEQEMRVRVTVRWGLEG